MVGGCRSSLNSNEKVFIHIRSSNLTNSLGEQDRKGKCLTFSLQNGLWEGIYPIELRTSTKIKIYLFLLVQCSGFCKSKWLKILSRWKKGGVSGVGWGMTCMQVPNVQTSATLRLLSCSRETSGLSHSRRNFYWFKYTLSLWWSNSYITKLPSNIR